MRRLQFKFPNQIRISGWDFGSSARAMNQAGGKDSLMTYEVVPTAQADLEKVSRSTTERKSMSTKTSIKRIALATVVALGFGMVSTVSANAASGDLTGKVACTSATTALNAATAGLAETSTAEAPYSFSVVANTTFKCTAVQDTAYSAVDADAFSTSDFSTTASTVWTTENVGGSGTSTSTSATTAAILTATAPDTAGTYYLRISKGSTYAYVKLTVVSMHGTLGDGTNAYGTGSATASSAGAASMNGVAGPANTVTLTAIKNAAGGKKGFVVVSGASATIASGGTVSANYLSTTIAADGAGTQAIVISTPAAGTITASYYAETSAGSGIYSTTAASTVTVTVNSSALSGVYASNTVYAKSGSTATPGDLTSATTDTFNSTTQSYTAAASTTAKATFKVNQYDSSGVALDNANAKAMTISTTIGSVGTVAGTPVGSYTAVAAATDDQQLFYLFSDGRSGKATVTIAVNGVTAATFDVTFVSTTIASLTLTPYKNVIAPNVGSATGGAASATDDAGDYARSSWQFILVAKDANGNENQSSTTPSVTVTSSNPACATAAIVASSWSDVYGGWKISGTPVGSSCETTITVADSATGLIKQTGTIRVGSTTISSIVLALDSATYAPGEKVTVTLTAKDSAGLPIADGVYFNLLTDRLGSTQVISSYPWDKVTDYYDPGDVSFTGGVAKATFYAPGYDFTVTAGLSTSARLVYALQATDLTATAKVSSAANDAVDAANDAVEAANAATDAANAAAEAADAATAAAQDAQAAVADLAAQVATLISGIKAQITRLTNLVIKIQKKVRA